MTAPYYISETKSDMRGIKQGWYAIEMTVRSILEPFPASRNAPTESHLYRHPTLRAAPGGLPKTAP
jgi:hypothetical protein